MIAATMLCNAFVPTTFSSPQPPSSTHYTLSFTVACSASASEVDCNMDQVIKTLKHDYHHRFSNPDFSIYSDGISVHDNSGIRLHGIQQYRSIFSLMQWLKRSVVQKAEVTHRLSASRDGTRIWMKWSAKLQVNDPTVIFGASDHILDGVSVYELDSQGLVNVHRLENIVLRREKQTPVSLSFVWPSHHTKIPELAAPFFGLLCSDSL